MSSVGIQKVQDKNLDGIMRHIRNYMSLREQQACRINVGLVGVITDIVWMQMENLQKTLLGFKSYGPEKYRVADVLAGWDDVRKREFFQLTGQNSIMHEISPQDDVNKKHSVAEEAIHDMKTFFKALNPGVDTVVGLIESWIMWDLQDASDVFNFEEQMKKLEILRTRELPLEVCRQYSLEMSKHAGGEDPSQADIYAFELTRLRHILGRLITRRGEHKPYQMLIARQESSGNSVASEAEIMTLARHCRAMEVLRSLPEGVLSDEKLRAHYVPILKTSDVTKAAAMEYEQSEISLGKLRLKEEMADDNGGVPYDYKMSQVRDLMARVEAETQAGKKSAYGTVVPDAPDPNVSMTMSGVFKLS